MMSQPPQRPPQIPDSFLHEGLTTHLQSLNSRSTPPPPPPNPMSGQGTPQQSGPPLPPPPITNASPGEGRYSLSQQQPPAAPKLEEGWLPPILRDVSKADLETLLSSPALLDALLRAPSTTHPSVSASATSLTHALAGNSHLATHLISLSANLAKEREALTSRLLQQRALERQWRLKQADMDDALEPFSPKALHARLVAGVAEQEALLAAMEESFLEGEGRAGEREVVEFVRRCREGRKTLGLRQERRKRFEEGRVGGWR